jgi:hypothetical protein
MPTLRSAFHWVFGKHPPRPPDAGRTVEAAWVPHWQARMIVDELVAEGIPAVMTEDFSIHLTMYNREPMARIFVTEDRQADARALVGEILGHPPSTRHL